MSPETKTFPVCHMYSKQHKGSYKKCCNITEDMCARVDQMVKDETFDNKSGGGNNLAKTKSVAIKYKKEETVNMVVQEEDNGEETEVKDDDLPTREHLLRMLGMSNILVDNVSEIEEPATKSKGCWDGDTLSCLGFGNIQVGGTDRDVDHEKK